MQPNSPLTDEHTDPLDPPWQRANNQRGRETYANDRPPIVGTIGRESGQVRLRVVLNTTGETLETPVHQFTCVEAMVYTDESNGYNHIIRLHATVEHGIHEYARDDDSDGIREAHCNNLGRDVDGCPQFSAPVQRRSQEISCRVCGDLRISTKFETRVASIYFISCHLSHFLHLGETTLHQPWIV
ncbi:MAG: transposase [Chloroflexi bacterium]|nr:transposase [Chloroflexota bacterium]